VNNLAAVDVTDIILGVERVNETMVEFNFKLFLLFIINSSSLEIDNKFHAKGKHEIKYRAGLFIICLL